MNIGIASAARASHRRQRTSTIALVSVVVDLGAILGAFLLAYAVRDRLDEVGNSQPLVPLGQYLGIMFAFAGILLLLQWFSGVYRLGRRPGSWLQTFYGIFTAASAGIAAAMALTFLLHNLGHARSVFLLAWLFSIVSLVLARLASAAIRRYAYARGLYEYRVAVVADPEVAPGLVARLARSAASGYTVAGVVTPDPAPMAGDGPRVLGQVDELPWLAARFDLDEVLVRLGPRAGDGVVRALQACRGAGIPCSLLPDVDELQTAEYLVYDLNGVTLISRKETRPLYPPIKRLLDLALGLLLLAVLAPVMLVIAAAIRLDSPGPILYRQVRLGKDGVPFTLYKFRSMHRQAEALLRELLRLNEADGPIFKLRRDPRVTRVGAVLRRTSLDELPQLFNVVLGQMSLVGPRPPLGSEVEQYEEWQRGRLAALPGLTGLWQVSGRSDVSFDDMVRLDLHYIQNCSLGLDLRILLRTVPAVLSGRGAY